MAAQDINRQHLIIGGTIKGATSSVFTYLSAHPEVCGSSLKETSFFSRGYKGELSRDHKVYSRYFRPDPEHKVLVEASPDYLGNKDNIVPRISTLLPEVQLLFILRNPIDRLYSHYNFAVGKLELSDLLSFEDYVDLCEKYTSEKIFPREAGVWEMHLRALEIGAYAKYLKNYSALFPAENIKVTFFEHLKRNPFQFMVDVCRFVGIDPDFYQNHPFNKVNVTFSARVKPIHFIAVFLNRALESMLRQRPGLKMPLVRLYKRFNQASEGYAPMKDATRKRLAAYYTPSNHELKTLLANHDLPSWVK